MADSAPTQKTSIWSVGFISLIVVNLFQYMGQMMMNTVIPLYAYDMGATATLVGVITGAFGLTALASRPFAGPAFDSFSKKWLFFGSMCIYVVATVLYGFASSFPELLGVRLLHGLAMGFSGPLGLARATQMLPADKMASGIGFYSAAQVVGQALGPAVGLWLVEAYGYPSVFTFSGIFITISAILLFFLKEPPGPERKPYRLSFNRMFAPKALMPALILFLLNLPYICTTAFVVIYAGLFGVEGIGLYFTVYAVCLMVTRPVFGSWADRFGIAKVLIPSMICYSVSFVLLAFSTTLPMFLVAAVLSACGLGASSPLIQTLAMKLVPLDARGSASNTVFAGLDFSCLIGPVVGGAIVEAMRGVVTTEAAAYTGMWFIMLIPIFVTLVIFILWNKKPKTA